MAEFDSVRGILPIVRPGPTIEIRWELHEERRVELPSKLWVDHISSVAEFKTWKIEHPNDGTMTVLYHWAPQIIAIASVVTFNPVILIASVAMRIDRKKYNAPY